MEDKYKLNVIHGINYKDKIYKFLCEIDSDFVPKISSRVDLNNWANKMSRQGTFFCHSDINDNWLSLAVCYDYLDDVYWTFFGVLKKFRRLNLGIEIEKKIIEYYSLKNKRSITGEVRESNKKMIEFHKFFGFEVKGVKGYDGDEKKIFISRTL